MLQALNREEQYPVVPVVYPLLRGTSSAPVVSGGNLLFTPAQHHPGSDPLLRKRRRQKTIFKTTETLGTVMPSQTGVRQQAPSKPDNTEIFLTAVPPAAERETGPGGD